MGGGAVFVVGSATCVSNDLSEAFKLRPNADVIAVKFSVAIVKAKHAVTHHPEHAVRMKKLHREKWGGEIVVHTPYKSSIKPDDLNSIDCVWSCLAGIRGTSGWGAARIASLLGYDEVILCGCPIDIVADDEPFFDATIKRDASSVGASNQRGIPWKSKTNLDEWHSAIQKDISAGLATNIRSMSGWTRQVLGAPNGSR